MRLRWTALKLGLSGLFATTFAVQLIGGCGGDSGGLGPADDTGIGDGETDGSGCGFSASFVSPADKAKLGIGDDLSGKKCADGLVTTVRVATSAPDGTSATLYANDKQVGKATVSSAQVTFANVSLPSKGPVAFKVQVGDDASCGIATESISVDCGLPACAVSVPTGKYLNGRLVADGGDRVSAATDPFATKVVITTDIEDGQVVSLSIDGKTPTKGTASGGKATFDSVTMAPDGVHTVAANCTNAAGNVGGSGTSDFTVLTAPVDLKVTQPADGKAFGLADDVDTATPGVQFKVCGTTATAAAVDLPADAKLGQKNFCSAIGTGTPACVAMVAATAGGGGSVCQTVTCPDGAAPFDVNVVLSDVAGNQAKASAKGIHCESKLPSVQIVAPLAYNSADPTTILNLSRGETGSSAGALKKTVVACTDKSSGSAELFAGLAGGTLVSLGKATIAAAVAGDGCPSGFANVAKFAGVVLPESTEKNDGSGALTVATELRVDVTDTTGGVGKSPNLDVWVDSKPPSMSLSSPSCGKAYASTTDVTDKVTLLADTVPLTLKVTGTSTTGSYPVATLDAPGTAPGVVTINPVTFYVGTNALSVSATDAAGNAGTGSLGACSIFVGNPPVIAITSPTDGSKLPADSNVDATTHKYKTNVTGTVTGTTSATTVTLKFGTTVLTAPITAGAFTFTGVLLDENDALRVTVELTDSIYGVRSTSETLIVDTHAPTMSGALTVVPSATKRRAGGVDLSWTAATDFDPVTSGSRACDHYEVRRVVSPGAAIASEAAWSAATVASASVLGSLTSTTITGGRLPIGYFYGLRCVDKAGNQSAIVNNSSVVIVDYLVNSLTAPSGTAAAALWGRSGGGAANFNGDAFPDLLVGSNVGTAYVYFGHAPTSSTDTGYGTTPDLTITGAGSSFGFEVAVLEDFDGDGRSDIAVGDYLDDKLWIVSGKALVASATPVSVATYGTNSLIITGDGTTVTNVANRVASAGNFDGDSGKHTDVLFRAKWANGGINPLTVFVAKGRAIDGSTITLPGGADFAVASNADPPTSLFGTGLGARDIDGDGFSDIVVGDSKQGVFVFKGRALGSTIATPFHLTDASSSLPVTTDNFGFTVSLPGSFGGTTSQDLVIGAWGANSQAGRFDIASSSGINYTVNSSIVDSHGSADLTTVERLGRMALTALPSTTFDVDNDGKADILACRENFNGFAPGRCDLYYGRALPASLATATYDASFYYEPASAAFGAAFPIGDTNADGYVDFAICSPQSNLCRIVR